MKRNATRGVKKVQRTGIPEHREGMDRLERAIPGIIVHRMRRRFAVTTKRVIERTVFPSIRVKEFHRDQLTDVHVHQDLLGRLFDYGTIVMETTGEHGQVVWRGVFPLRKGQAVLEEMLDRQSNEIEEGKG